MEQTNEMVYYEPLTSRATESDSGSGYPANKRPAVLHTKTLEQNCQSEYRFLLGLVDTVFWNVFIYLFIWGGGEGYVQN